MKTGYCKTRNGGLTGQQRENTVTQQLQTKIILKKTRFFCWNLVWFEKFGVPMKSDAAPFIANLFLLLSKKKVISWNKNGTCERLVDFQTFLDFEMAHALSIIITMIFIIISWSSRRKMEILVKPCFWAFKYKCMIKNLQLICLIKEMPFPFIACSLQSHVLLDSIIPSKRFYT